MESMIRIGVRNRCLEDVKLVVTKRDQVIA